MKKTQKSKSPKVGIIMGSDSDYPVMKEAGEALRLFKIPFEILVLSAHRAPTETMKYAANARKRGLRVIIAGAGSAAHLGGVIAAMTELPVIGVPIAVGTLGGQDALLSMVQMPRGIPVATVAINNAWNAGILSAQILGAGADFGDTSVLDRVSDYKEDLRKKVLAKKVG